MLVRTLRGAASKDCGLRWPSSGSVLPTLTFLMLMAVSAGALRSHEVRFELEGRRGITLRFLTSDGSPFAHRSVAVYSPTGKEQYQTGRTDAAGRFAFVPDRKGDWRVRVSSHQGHGTEALVVVEQDQVARVRPRSLFDESPRVAAGLGMLLGIIGVAALLFSRRRPVGPGRPSSQDT